MDLKMAVGNITQRIAEGRALAPGMMFCVVLAAAATFLSQSHGGPVVLYALLLGMPFNFLAGDGRLTEGINTASRDVLRLGVALLGARITFDQILAVGWPVMLAVAASIGLTIAFGALAATWLGLPRRFGILSAGATAICGASAAAAISSVLPRYTNLERDTAVTIVGVTTLSTVAMIAYPAIARWLGLGNVEIGIFIGATIHDVAQVVGAGYSVSVEAGDKATIVKLFRVALLLPVVVAIALASRHIAGEDARTPKSLLPWFLIAFAALVIANSAGLIPASLGSLLAQASRWCIVVAIAALGVKTALKSFAEVGRPAVGMMIAETVFLATLFLTLMLLLK